MLPAAYCKTTTGNGQQATGNRRQRRKAAAFTLVEMLISVALVGALLVMLSFHLFSLSQIWLKSAGDDFFAQHVDGVTLFLNQSLALSEGLPATEKEAQALPVEWAKPPGWGELRDPLLLYRQKEAPPLFVREGQNLPDVLCFLYYERGEGLSILWYSKLQEQNKDAERMETDDLQRTLVSAFVTQIEYCYYDQENDDWRITTDPEKGENDTFKLPQFLRLTFEHEGETLVRTVYLPQRSPDVPLF